jgi:hypothetical protein
MVRGRCSYGELRCLEIVIGDFAAKKYRLPIKGVIEWIRRIGT